MDDINDTDDLVSVGTHLTKEEADSIKSGLTSMNVDFVVNGHDAASRYSSLYYEIKVKRGDARAAKQVIDKRRARNFVESRKCPKCKNLVYREIEKKGLWERIYYFGTTLVQCQKCKTKYSI